MEINCHLKHHLFNQTIYVCTNWRILFCSGDNSIQCCCLNQHVPCWKQRLPQWHHKHDEINCSNSSENRLQVQHQSIPLLCLCPIIWHPAQPSLGQTGLLVWSHAQRLQGSVGQDWRKIIAHHCGWDRMAISWRKRFESFLYYVTWAYFKNPTNWQL